MKRKRLVMVLDSKSFVKGTCFGFLLLFSMLSAPHAQGQEKDLPAFSWAQMVFELPGNTHYTHIQPEFLAAKIFPSIRPAPVLVADSLYPNRFKIYWHHIPICNGWVLTRLTANKRGLSVDFPQLRFEALSFVPPTEKDLFWVAEPEGLRAMVRTIEKRGLQTWFTWKEPHGNPMYAENWQLSSGTDTLIRATVFKPDPVSRLRTVYGGLLRDRQDSGSSMLSAALDTVQIRLKFQNNRFFLHHPAFRIGEFAAPEKPAFQFIHPDSFLVQRNHPAFEAINVFYHITRFRSFVDSLGFSSMLTPDLRIDVHGMGGADQSAYDPSEDLLSFGDGNVDDAEDAGVVIHEYGHVLGQAAIPFGNSGQERRSIEEGICDYLAGSYARSLSDFEPLKLFKWDGHNEFWSGRTLNTPRMYPENLVGQIHRDGEIFAAALMAGELAIGRPTMNRLILTFLPTLVPNASMPLAARLLLNADTILSGGAHAPLLRQAFLSKGINPGQLIVSTGFRSGEGKNWVLSYTDQPWKAWKLTGLAKTENTAELLDLSGRVIATYFTDSSALFVPAENLQPGIYLIRVLGPKGARTEKVVVFP